MMNSESRCPKCKGEMQEGFIVDRADSPRSGLVSSWVAGEPKKSSLEGVDVDGKTLYPVQSFRCRGCGYLESYAIGS